MSNDLNQDIAKELVSRTAGKTYDDLVHPTAQATGGIISFIPRTIRVWFGKWEKWILNGEYAIRETEKLLEEKLKHIPEDKIVEPEPYVVVPAIQQLSYSLDSEELRELYANLLASSINADTKKNVHPSFAEIIKQLSPLDARVVEMIKHNQKPIPIITGRLNYEVSNTFSEIVRDYSTVLYSIYQDVDELAASLQNLKRLGLINVRYDQVVKPDTVYDVFETDTAYQQIKESVCNIPNDQCLNRDEGWKAYYADQMNNLVVETGSKDKLYSILQREKEAFDYSAIRNYEKAFSIVQGIVNSCIDDEEKGWYLQLAAKYQFHISQTKSKALRTKTQQSFSIEKKR